MFLLKARRGFCVALLFIAWGTSCGAALPTGEEILKVYRANREAFSRAHLQWVHTEEATEASVRAEQRRIDEKAKLTEAIYQTPSKDLRIDVGNQTLVGHAVIQFLQQAGAIFSRDEAANLPEQAPKPFRAAIPFELFMNGQEYQFRRPQHRAQGPELARWSFSEAPLTSESLETIYADYSLFSRSPAATPPARWWSGGSAGSTRAYVMAKHYPEVSHTNLPPCTEFITADWGSRHPYDHFFSRPADEYRVVREEESDGRLLTVVDVKVPMGEGATSALGYRGWLDLKRGAVPIRMVHSQLTPDAALEVFDQWTEFPETITTHHICEVPGPAFYPAKVVKEHWGEESAPEAPAGAALVKREAPPKPSRVVLRRHTWDVSLVELRAEWPPGFFEIPFPAGEPVFDHDAGLMIGGFERQPLVQVGQNAPSLTIGRWLDERPRTLADLKGQVVVLSFWDHRDKESRETASTLNDLRKLFDGESVVFVSIHCAGKDPTGVAAKIAAFKKEAGWHDVAALDAGTMPENSATLIAYGGQFLPLTVIIGPDGKIAYVDQQDVGAEEDRVNPVQQAAFEVQWNDWMKTRFETVGESWPIDDTLNDEEQMAIYRRAERKFLAHVIREALKSGERK